MIAEGGKQHRNSFAGRKVKHHGLRVGISGQECRKDENQLGLVLRVRGFAEGVALSPSRPGALFSFTFVQPQFRGHAHWWPDSEVGLVVHHFSASGRNDFQAPNQLNTSSCSNLNHHYPSYSSVQSSSSPAAALRPPPSPSSADDAELRSMAAACRCSSARPVSSSNLPGCCRTCVHTNRHTTAGLSAAATTHTSTACSHQAAKQNAPSAGSPSRPPRTPAARPGSTRCTG